MFTDTQRLEWLLGRLHIEREADPINNIHNDVWSTVGFSALHWDCKAQGEHNMRSIIDDAMSQ